MKAIVAVDKNWGIGKDGDLLLSIPEDMKFFRKTTSGGVVIMGRKTLDSFPGGNPLKNRINIVLTRNTRFEKEGVIVVHNEEELDLELEKIKTSENGEELMEKAFVIGGASVYGQLLDKCETIYVTKMDKAFDADVFFPNLDEKDDWEIAEEGSENIYVAEDGETVSFRFLTYQKA